MKDYYKNTIKKGDILLEMKHDSCFIKWEVIDFGIEPSSKKNICVLKNIDTNYIACCYQSELYLFTKVVEN